MNEQEIEALPSVLTVEDIQKILRIGKNKAYELIYQKNFPVIRLGRKIRIPKKELLDWIKTQTKVYEFQN